MQYLQFLSFLKFISLYAGVDVHILLSDKMQRWSSLSPSKPENVFFLPSYINDNLVGTEIFG